MKLFQGSGVALVTPFNNDVVDYQSLQRLIEWHITNKTDAVIVCGSTGESATLTFSEKQKIISFAAHVARKRIPIIAGTGFNSTAQTIELSIFAESEGADALMIVCPYYIIPTQKGLYAHFKAIARAVKIPIVIYNVPSRTGINILPETVASLAQINNIIGIKEASGDFSQIVKLFTLCPSDFNIYSGNDDQIIPVLALGGKGVISVTANLLPHEIHTLVEQYMRGNKHLAVKAFLKLRALNQVLFTEPNPVPIKKAMNLIGLDVGECRLPLVEMEPKNLELLKQEMIAYGLLEKKVK